MEKPFNIGIETLPTELNMLQAPGLYWLCITDTWVADSLTQQLLCKQPSQSAINLIIMNEAEENTAYAEASLLARAASSAPCTRFSLPAHINAFNGLAEDLRRTRLAAHSLIILRVSAEIVIHLESPLLVQWLEQIKQYLTKQQSTLVILSDGTLNAVVEKCLLAHHRLISGLVSINSAIVHKNYYIHWWANVFGVAAQKRLTLIHEAQHWQIKTPPANAAHSNPLPISDAHLYYANEVVLEGTPPLSDHWRLFPNNALLVANLTTIKAATAIFALNQIDALPKLAAKLHQLRQTCGNALKIVVRELTPCLRHSDECALLACGVNLIVPHSESLSSFLTRLEGVQGTIFQRNLTPDVTQLFTNINTIKQRGLVDFVVFNKTITHLIKHAYQPNDHKGILIALAPVTHLSPTQALDHCILRRSGDVALLTHDQLYLFLSACRITNVPLVLTRIFNRPLEQLFIQQTFWHFDREILNELARLKKHHTMPPTTQYLGTIKRLMTYDGTP